MDIAYFLKTFAALFAMASPIANLPVFLSLTAEYDAGGRARVALTVAVAMAIGGTGVLVGGEAALALFGLNIDHFRLAGGLLILLIALKMVQGIESHAQSRTPQEKAAQPVAEDPSIYPLTVPILLGPGTISTLILFGHGASGLEQTVAVWTALAASIALLTVSFLVGGPLSSLLGASATSVMSRLMGMILAAIGLEMMVESLAKLLPGLAE